MKLAVDVHYENTRARVAGLLFTDWNSDHAEKEITTIVDDIEEYEPGAFYKRELPCIAALLNQLNLNPEVIIIDGYVVLGNADSPGLGVHLYQYLQQSVPIIGVAKNAFRETPENCRIYRGESQKPLFITAVGMTLEPAKKHIMQMHGRHRIPTLLKRVDQLCRHG